jgi:hypothetical protein
LSLIGFSFRAAKLDNKPAQRVVEALEEAALLLPDWSLRRMLRAALDYAKRIELAAEVKLNPVTGQPEGVTPKIMLREPGVEERKHGFISVDTLLETADQALGESERKFWIVLDRLDVAFVDTPELEANALRALFRVYRDMASLSNFGVKIFLRDDIWARITSAGFREASHFTRSITITWTASALLHLVIRRALHNDAVRDFYRVDRSVVLASSQEQEKLFYRIFPDQVDPGKRKSTTFDWLLSRTTDGTKQPAPRELIHLLAAIRDQQLKSLEMGAPEPPNEALFDRAAIKAALPEVSKVRYEQTLLAEHPGLKPLLSHLEGKKTQQTPNTLAKIWGVSREEATASAEKLTEVGFFEKRGTREQPLFWVPFIYRDALKMPQGSEE